jgi:Carboxypeptidase regulatory-like domain/TonB dependent receptor-like, beta-barrel
MGTVNMGNQMGIRLLRLPMLVLVLGAIGFLVPKTVPGQQVSGTITGYVTDPSGAAIPGAAVTVTNAQTGISTERNTEPSGLYIFTNLIPGTYTVSVVTSGFQKFVRQNVVLSVDSTVTVDAEMTLGQVSQEVTVSGAPPVLNMQKADVSSTLSSQAVEELPTLSRNISSLIVLAPGVTQNSYQQGVSEQPAGGFEATANGQFWGVNNYQLDGISDTQTGLSGYQILVPPADGVQEMKVTTADYDAELGQVAGAVVQYSTKSGTNKIHGSAYEFNRNKATFAANPYTEKIPGTGPNGKGTGPSPYNENIFGASIGGPIKKDKLFYFTDYQGYYVAQSSAFLGTAPNTDFQTGNLTAALGSKICFDPSSPSSNGACGGSFTSPLMVPTTEGGTIQAQQNMVFDPTTGNPDGSGREAFAVGGIPNMIPTNRINQVSNNLIGLLYQNLGHGVLNQALTDNNFSSVVPGLFHTNQWDGRVDYNLSENNRMFFRYSLMNALLNDPPIFGLAGGPSAIGSEGELGHYRNQLGALNFTHTFSPTLVAEFRFGITRFALTGYQYDSAHDTDNQVGILGINTGSPLYGGLAGITIGGPVGAFSMGDPSGQGLPRLNYDTTFEWDSNWNKLLGKHQLRWGIDVIRERENFLTVNESSRGNFAFNQDVTSVNGISGTGLGMGTFLLGMPSEFDRAVFSQLPAERDWRIAPYFEDDVHATSKLTLNLGVRYDYIGPSTPAFPGGGVNFDPVTGNLILGGLGAISASENVRPNYANFEPRLGFAYRVLSHTVVRGGFGRAYFSAQYGGGIFGTMCCSYPVQTREDVNTRFNSTSYFPIQFPGQATAYALDPNTPLPPAPLPTAPSNGIIPITTVPGLGAFAVPFDNPTPYVDSWNLTVQQQLKPNLSLTAAYVGNVGRHNYGSWDLNAPMPGPGSLTSREPLYQSLGVDWTGIGERCNCQSSDYNGLQVVLDKRFTGDYSIHSAFTWSKALDLPYGGFSSGPMNPYDRNLSRAPDYNDRAIVWNVSHEWRLPFGKGQHFGTNSSGAEQAVIGGWVFNGVTTIMSGLPTFISWGDTSSLNNGGDYGQRPDLVGNPNKGTPAGLWFNPAAFANPSPYNFGNADRVVVGPHFFDVNWSFWKEFKIKENLGLQLRFESFNLFNSTNKSNPNGSADSSTAGVITGTLVPMRQFQFGARLSW